MQRDDHSKTDLARRLSSITGKDSGDAHPNLKRIAGFIQGLTFREMKTFAELIASHTPDTHAAEITEALLSASDTILETQGNKNGIVL